MMVGAGYERVFEVAHVYRAEQHNTNRHLNEYIAMDLEMGFIESEEDVMNMEENLFKAYIRQGGKRRTEIFRTIKYNYT